MGTNITLWATNNIQAIFVGTNGNTDDTYFDTITFAKPGSATNSNFRIYNGRTSFTDAGMTYIDQVGGMGFDTAGTDLPLWNMQLENKFRNVSTDPFQSEWFLQWTSPDKLTTRRPLFVGSLFDGTGVATFSGLVQFKNDDASITRGTMSSAGELNWLGTALFQNTLQNSYSVNGDNQILLRNLNSGVSTKVGIQLTVGSGGGANLGTYLGMNSSTVGHQWLQGMIGTPYTYRWAYGTGNLLSGALMSLTTDGNLGIGATNPAARLVVNGAGLFTNGVASFSSVSPVTIAATGWTNIWSTNNAIVHFDGTSMFFTNVLRGNTPWYTNTAAHSGAMTTTLQPGEAIRIAGTSVVGRAKPF